MKDLETPEQRAMEREMLRAAREHKRVGGDRSHIAIGIILLIVAFALQVVGYSGMALVLLLGLAVEMAAYVVLGANRSMPKVEVRSAALEKRPEGN